jgi:hypothetical protein
VGLQKGVVGFGENVDNGVADADYVECGVCHLLSFVVSLSSKIHKGRLIGRRQRRSKARRLFALLICSRLS